MTNYPKNTLLRICLGQCYLAFFLKKWMKYRKLYITYFNILDFAMIVMHSYYISLFSFSGRSYKIENMRQLNQCLESICQKCQSGTVLNFQIQPDQKLGMLRFFVWVYSVCWILGMKCFRYSLGKLFKNGLSQAKSTRF